VVLQNSGEEIELHSRHSKSPQASLAKEIDAMSLEEVQERLELYNVNWQEHPECASLPGAKSSLRMVMGGLMAADTADKKSSSRWSKPQKDKIDQMTEEDVQAAEDGPRQDEEAAAAEEEAPAEAPEAAAAQEEEAAAEEEEAVAEDTDANAPASLAGRKMNLRLQQQEPMWNEDSRFDFRLERTQEEQLLHLEAEEEYMQQQEEERATYIEEQNTVQQRSLAHLYDPVLDDSAADTIPTPVAKNAPRKDRKASIDNLMKMRRDMNEALLKEKYEDVAAAELAFDSYMPIDSDGKPESAFPMKLGVNEAELDALYTKVFDSHRLREKPMPRPEAPPTLAAAAEVQRYLHQERPNSKHGQFFVPEYCPPQWVKAIPPFQDGVYLM